MAGGGDWISKKTAAPGRWRKGRESKERIFTDQKWKKHPATAGSLSLKKKRRII